LLTKLLRKEGAKYKGYAQLSVGTIEIPFAPWNRRHAASEGFWLNPDAPRRGHFGKRIAIQSWLWINCEKGSEVLNSRKKEGGKKP
jgi:hypothetical protein